MPREQLNVLTYSTWSETHRGVAMPLREIADRFQAYSLETAVGLLTRIEFLLWNADRQDSQVQDYIGEGLLGANDWRAMVAAAKGTDPEDVPSGQTRPVMWFTQLVLNAAKVAILECPLEKSAAEPPDLKGLAIAILGLSDHIELASPARGTLEAETRLRHHVIVNSVFNEAERQMTLLPLGRRIYLDAHADLRTSHDYVNLPELLERAIQLDPDALLAIGIGVSAYWQSRDTTKFHLGVAPLDLKEYMRTTKVTAEQVDTFLRVTARDPKEMRRAVAGRYSLADLKPFSFVPIAETPIVAFGNRQYCLSFKLLTRRLSTDLHYFFLQYLGEADRKRYLFFHGVVFEETVHRTFRQCLRRVRRTSFGAPLARYFELDRLETQPEERRADAAIVTPEVVILLDAKAGRYPAPVFDGDLAALEGFIESNLLKAAGQIDATFNRLKDGSLRVPHLDLARVRHIIPVVVMLQYVGWNPLLAEHVAAQLAAKGLLADPRFTELQLVELESLLILADNRQRGDLNLPGLFLERAQNRWFSGNSFHNFLYAQGDRISWRTPSLRRELNELFADVTRYMRFEPKESRNE